MASRPPDSRDAARRPMDDPNSKVIGIVGAGADTAHMLDEMLSQSLMAAVIFLVPKRAGQNGAARGTEHLAAAIRTVQSHGAAALLADDAGLAQDLKADGVHISHGPDVMKFYLAARSLLGREANIGVEAGASRHDAMELGEAGADYIAFGLRADAADADEATTERHELITWWADVFEVPCVALDVTDADEAGLLVEAGADFVAYRLDAPVVEQPASHV